MKRIRKKVILIILILMLNAPELLIAQPDFGDDTQDVPFDGGISVLIAAGMAYGLKKAFNSKKQKNYRSIKSKGV